MEYFIKCFLPEVAARTNAAIDASLRVEAQTTLLGRMKKNAQAAASTAPLPPLWLRNFGRSVVMTKLTD